MKTLIFLRLEPTVSHVIIHARNRGQKDVLILARNRVTLVIALHVNKWRESNVIADLLNRTSLAIIGQRQMIKRLYKAAAISVQIM